MDTMDHDQFPQYKCRYAISSKSKQRILNSRVQLDPIYKLFPGQGELFYFPMPNLPGTNACGAIDNKVLAIDPWPAYATERINTDSQVLTVGNRLFVQNQDESKLKPPPKPRLLLVLENRIRKQIKRFNIPNDRACTLRLQLYGEIFERFINECAYYGPLLAEIKDQYEGFIEHLKKQIRDIHPIKELLWTVSLEAEQRVDQFQKKDNVEISFLKSERQRDTAKLENMKQECVELQVAVDKLTDKLDVRNEICRVESDGRKILIGDVNDLNSRLHEMEILARADKDRNTDDPIKLKIQIEQLMQHIKMQNTKLRDRDSDYNEKVDLKVYEEVVDKLNQKAKEVDALNDDLESGASRYSLLKDHCETLTTWRDLYNIQLVYIARVLNSKSELPNKIDYISGLLTKYRKLGQNKSPEDLAAFISQDITKAESGGLPPMQRSAGNKSGRSKDDK